jgi:hypothetical protein
MSRWIKGMEVAQIWSLNFKFILARSQEKSLKKIVLLFSAHWSRCWGWRSIVVQSRILSGGLQGHALHRVQRRQGHLSLLRKQVLLLVGHHRQRLAVLKVILFSLLKIQVLNVLNSYNKRTSLLMFQWSVRNGSTLRATEGFLSFLWLMLILIQKIWF